MSSPEPQVTAPPPSIFGVSFTEILTIIVIAAIAIAVERVVTRYLGHFAKRAKLEPDTSNNLALTFRILVLIGAVIAISRVGGVDANFILSVSAIGGAAVGFASQKTIGNFIAGIFLIAARPFKVGNYVRIGTVEGIVSEITINYTKILTLSDNVVSISNLQILDRDITNFLTETTDNMNLYCYTFEIGFDHSVATNTIVQIFDEVFGKYDVAAPKKPSYVLTRSGAFERIYTIYLYVKDPQDIFTLRPLIAKEIFQRWDEERAKQKN